MTAGKETPDGTIPNYHAAVQTAIATDMSHAYVNIRLMNAFTDKDTQEDALDQLFDAIQQAARILNNHRTRMHLHHIAYDQQCTHKHNIATFDYFIGQSPSYTEVVEAIYQLTIHMDSLMSQPHNTHLSTHQIFLHLSC